MGIIIFTVVVQGALVPKDQRGSFSLPLLTINGGVFQAIGVISFGTCFSLVVFSTAGFD